jgi:hypothetical protein
LAGSSWLQQQIMSRFAPVDIPIGLHWHPYGSNVLPPILDLPDLPVSRGGHLLVYLPFEDQDAISRLWSSGFAAATPPPMSNSRTWPMFSQAGWPRAVKPALPICLDSSGNP